MAWIQRISRLPRAEKEGLYRILIPPALYHRHNIDPLFLSHGTGARVVRFFCPDGERTCLVEIKLAHMEEPLYSIQLTDASDATQIDMDFLIANDPDSLRFNTHVDEEGRDTLFGWASRNIREEVRALEAGLFPGQVRKGLGITRDAVEVMEFFCRIFDLKCIKLEPLFYHNAITYERYGFSYFDGYLLMKRIHELFQPGGKLYEKLDGSTPFRLPEFARSVRGRSWAIHDGILLDVQDDLLAEGWVSPVMYRMVGKPRAMVTYPDPVY